MKSSQKCATCKIEKPIASFKRLTGYKQTAARECDQCKREKIEKRIQYETDVKLKEFSYKVSRMTNRSSIEKVTKQLLAAFGGPTKFAEAYFELYERIKYTSTESGSGPAAYMVIAVLNLCDAAGHAQEEALETDAYNRKLYGPLSS